MRGDVVDTPWEAVESALRPLIVDDETASEVLSSIYEIGWVPLDSPATTYSEGSDLGVLRAASWRAACDFVASVRGRGESYMDVVWDLDYEPRRLRPRRPAYAVARPPPGRVDTIAPMDGPVIYVDSDEFLDLGGSRSRSWFPDTPRLIPLWRLLRRRGFPRVAELLR